jgi:diguanylate cyclase (GGDEF)-like protein/PAS domain S-box-containing protein
MSQARKPGIAALAAPASLRARLILAFAALSVLLILGLGLLIRREADNTVVREIELALGNMAGSLREQLDQRMADIYREVNTAAALEPMDNPRADPAQRRKNIETMLRVRPHISWVAYTDKSGRVLQASRGMLEGVDVSARPWFGNALAGVHVTDVHEAKLLQALLAKPGDEPLRFVDIAFPYSGTGGGVQGVQGVLGVHISLEFARQMLLDMQRSGRRVDQADILLLDKKGKVLLGPRELEGSVIATPGVAALGKLGETAGLETWRDGKKYLVAYTRSPGAGDYPGLGWIVAVRQDAGVAYAPVERMNRSILLLGVTFVLLASALSWFVVSRLMKPLTDLTGAAERIGQGDTQTEFPADLRIPEVNRLSSALRDMTSALAAKERALQTSNRALEERVAERTAALLEATQELDNERESLAYALEGSMLATWDCDIATGVVRLSHGWSRMLGGPSEETTCHVRDLLALVPADERSALLASAMRVVKGAGYRYIFEHRVRCKDGGTIWVSTRGKVTSRDAEGKALRMTGTNADVSIAKRAEQALKDSEAKLRLVIDNIPLMINYVDVHCRFQFANRPYLEFLDLAGTSVAGKSLSEVTGVEAQKMAESHLPRLEAGEFVHYENKRADRHGRMRYFDVLRIPHFNEVGSLAGFISLIEDATERGEAARALAASESQLRLVSDNIPTMLCEVDLDGKLLFVNRRYNEFYGLRDGEAIGKRIVDIAGEGGQRAFEAHLVELKQGRSIVYSRPTDVEGRGVYLEVHLVPRRDASGVTKSVYAMINDVTARKQLEELLKQQALSDVLTGLPNRRLLRDRCELAISMAKRQESGVAVLYLDLDGFKLVNDTLGHEAGDELLKEVGARLSACVRETDTVARVGGDEFVVLLVACACLADAQKIAMAVRESLIVPFALAAGTSHISCSIGIALYPADGENAEGLLKTADAGMYEAKRAGKNRIAGLPDVFKAA